jgi:hypothetical protein
MRWMNGMEKSDAKAMAVLLRNPLSRGVGSKDEEHRMVE